MKHRGEIVKASIKKSGISITTIHKKLRVSRQTIYNWFDIPDLDWDKVFEIGKIIRHDFSDDFTELQNPNSLIREPAVDYTIPNSLEDCKQKLNEYKEKYLKAMEENNALYREIVELRSGEDSSASFTRRTV